MIGLDTIGPRNLLVIDTSTERAAVGVFVAPRSINWTSGEAARKHGRDLVPCVRDVLQTAGLDIRDLHVVAVGIGPGSFTGLRIGLTAAKTLAYATSADLVGFDSLEGLAANAPAEALCVHVVADAQRGDVYAADFARQARRGAALPRVREPDRIARRVVKPVGRNRGFVLGPGLASPSILAAIPAGTAIADPELPPAPRRPAHRARPPALAGRPARRSARAGAPLPAPQRRRGEMGRARKQHRANETVALPDVAGESADVCNKLPETSDAEARLPDPEAPAPARAFHVVLVEPEIAANTGAIGRTCVATARRSGWCGPWVFTLTTATCAGRV